MENAFSLRARKSFVFGSPQLIDDHLWISTASSCLSSQWCQSKGVAYPQTLLSFLASLGKRTNLSWAYIYMVTATTGSLTWPYVYGRHVQRVHDGPKNAAYTSPDNQNTHLNVMGNVVWSEISLAVVYCILADEMKGTEVPNPQRNGACDCTCVLTRRIDHCLMTLSCLPCACLCKVRSQIWRSFTGLVQLTVA